MLSGFELYPRWVPLSKVQFSAFFEYPEQHLLFCPVYHFKFFNVRIYT